MLRRLVLAALLLVPALGQPGRADEAFPTGCRGLAVGQLELRLEGEVQRYVLGPDMVPPFVQLWVASRRTALPARPETVTVYAKPDQPLMVAYHSDGCVLALLTIERGQLWELLRRRLGWVV